MANDERNLETIPTGALGLIPLASCTELGEKVNQYLVKWRDTRHNAHKDNLSLIHISEPTRRRLGDVYKRQQG